MSGGGNGGTKAPGPPGRCGTCREDIDRARLFEQGGQPGVKFHRDRRSNPCGPVLTEFFYRVVAWVETPDGRGRPRVYGISRHRPVESPADEAGLAAFIAGAHQTRGPQGELLVGVKPEVEVLWAELKEAR